MIKKNHYHADMISVEEACIRILEVFKPLNIVMLPIQNTVDLVIAVDVISNIDIPPMDNSSMDGYALIYDDICEVNSKNSIELKVIENIKAGSLPEQEIKKGTASRIMTGAPIPLGSDTVIPFEDTSELTWQINSKSNVINIMIASEKGSNIRKAGNDVKYGEKILIKGTIITPSIVGLLASLGLDHIEVHRRPKISVISTGDELLNPGQPSEKGKIFDSNSSALIAHARQLGAVVDFKGIAEDNESSVISKLNDSSDSDLIITSAGVSKGDYDVVKDVLTKKGELNFWSIRMRPAKPLAFGEIVTDNGNKIPIIGLPGNPVSSLVAFEQFCRPVIHKMLGKTNSDRVIIKAVLKDSIENYDGRRVYARVVVTCIDGQYIASSTGNQESNILTSMAKANGLAICPEDEISKNPGDEVDVIMIDRPGGIV
jgi:molybdopterin molybdotransferase